MVGMECTAGYGCDKKVLCYGTGNMDGGRHQHDNAIHGAV
jgi:hypothetical protein